jgi:hypothetical protein
MRAAREAAHDLRRELLAGKLAEELLDVLNLERALLELVLLDVVFHSSAKTRIVARTMAS